MNQPPPTPPPDDAIEKTMRMGNMTRQRSLWLYNIRQNLPLIFKSRDITRIANLLADLPGIIVGAGRAWKKILNSSPNTPAHTPLLHGPRVQKTPRRRRDPAFCRLRGLPGHRRRLLQRHAVNQTVLLSSIKISPQVLACRGKKILFFAVMDTDKKFEQAELNLTEHAWPQSQVRLSAATPRTPSPAWPAAIHHVRRLRLVHERTKPRPLGHELRIRRHQRK